MKSGIERLDDWFNTQCNGDWEHSHGIEIESVDNPGWMVTIDLRETHSEKLSVEVWNDGYEFETVDEFLHGYAEPRKLNDLLNAIADALDAQDEKMKEGK